MTEEKPDSKPMHHRFQQWLRAPGALPDVFNNPEQSSSAALFEEALWLAYQAGFIDAQKAIERKK